MCSSASRALGQSHLSNLDLRQAPMCIPSGQKVSEVFCAAFDSDAPWLLGIATPLRRLCFAKKLKNWFFENCYQEYPQGVMKNYPGAPGIIKNYPQGPGILFHWLHASTQPKVAKELPKGCHRQAWPTWLSWPAGGSQRLCCVQCLKLILNTFFAKMCFNYNSISIILV